MEYRADTVISEIVARDYRAAKVFKKYDIGFCCSGRTNLAEASEQRNIDVNALIAELEQVKIVTGNVNANYDNWPIDLLSDYIQKMHHTYVRESIPPLLAYLERIKLVHGDRHPELRDIYHFFNESAIVLSAHMKEEEKVLFPMFRQLAFQQDVDERLMKALINNMMEEHENEDEQFLMIKNLTNNYNPPQDACNTYRVAFGLLKEYHDDLIKHTHLENNVLFPAALNLI